MTEAKIKDREQTPEEIIEAREAALARLQLLPTTHDYTIFCRRTGVVVAKMELLQQAGKIPYLSQWHDSVAYHPLFALSQNQLLAFTRKNWNTLFRETVDRSTDVQREQFCIAFMAILHSCNCLDQQIPALPKFHTVAANMQRLLELAYWYNFLDSHRFKFPILRINKLNSNDTLSDVGAYLSVCESKKTDYENSKEAKAEEAKLEAARRAEKLVRSGHVRAVSKKALWNWFLASLADSNSKKYQLPEWQEWKEDSAKLWLADESKQLSYAIEDVDSIEEVFYAECALGTSVSNAFKIELGKIRTNITNHLKIFDIDWTTTTLMADTQIRRVKTDGTIIEHIPMPEEPGPEPTQLQFFSRTDFIRAHAKWHVKTLQWNAWQVKYKEAENASNAEDQSDASTMAKIV